MGYDDVFPYLGEFGKYQKRIYFLLCLPAIVCAFHGLAGPFLLATPDHRCLLPFEPENATYGELNETIKEMLYPYDHLKSRWSQCKYLVGNYSDEYFNGSTPYTEETTCEKQVYDTSVYLSSTVTEWDMVCDRAWLRALADSFYMTGVTIGAFIFGDLSDRFGRLPVFFASLVIQVVSGVFASISPEFITYSISRLVVGATASGSFLVSYVIAMEMVGPSYLTVAGTVCMMFTSIGFMLVAAYAHFFRNWRHLQMALTLSGVAFLSYWWFIPESVRWLLSKNRKSEAIEIIQKAAKENKVTIPQDVFDNLIEPQEKVEEKNHHKPSVIDIFRYPNLRRRAIVLFINWFINCVIYYALSWNTASLGGHYLVSFVISGFVELPAYFFNILILNKWGRKPIICGCMIIGGFALMLTGLVPKTQTWLLISLTMTGKLSITSSFNAIYIFSAEQFPTVIRNVGMGTASTIAHIGGVCAPFLNLLGEIWKPLPMILCGGLSIFGGIISLNLPETLNKKLPETIADGENFGKNRNDLISDSNTEEMKVLKTKENLQGIQNGLLAHNNNSENTNGLS